MDSDIALPPVTCQDVLNCSFSSWYNEFKKITFKSSVIPLPVEFIDYLNADGIFLPDDGQPKAANGETLSSDDEATDFDQEDGNSDSKTPHFPEIESAIREGIDAYNGAIFPKLNWSSPRDAAWISTTQSLKCTSPFDVFLLLKSSDFINHDLNHALDHCVDVEESRSPKPRMELVLRKWYDLKPSMEFRCFVRNGELIGICQRDSNFYAFLLDERDKLEEKIHDFFEDHIRDVFPSNHYVFDVYVETNVQKIWLMDFNPFSTTTDSLLYDWSELSTFDIESQDAELRLIESSTMANSTAFCAPRFATNMIPKDAIDLSNGRTIAEFAQEIQRAMTFDAETKDS